MNLLELIHSAVLSLRTHKLRVFLTMIGIIIGISSVVVILSVGEGLKAQVNQSTDSPVLSIPMPLPLILSPMI